MNRRRLLAAALPVLFGGGASRALAQDKPKPKRIRIEVSLQKPGLALSEINAQIIVLTTAEGVETNAMFLQMYTFRANKADNTVSSQAFGPKLTLTAHVEPNQHIHIIGTMAFEEATATTAALNEPLPLAATSLVLDHSFASGQAVTLGSTIVGKEAQTIQLTATLM